MRVKSRKHEHWKMINQQLFFCFDSTQATGLYLFKHRFQFTVSKASLLHCECQRSTHLIHMLTDSTYLLEAQNEPKIRVTINMTVPDWIWFTFTVHLQSARKHWKVRQFFTWKGKCDLMLHEHKTLYREGKYEITDSKRNGCIQQKTMWLVLSRCSTK